MICSLSLTIKTSKYQLSISAVTRLTSQEVVEGLMIASLATLTKGIMTHDEIAAKSNVMYSHNVSSKRLRSLDVFSAFSRNLPI